MRPVKLTYEDLLDRVEDGARHELFDGEHVVTPSPRPSHQAVVANLLVLLVPFVRRRRLGRVLPGPVDVVLSRFDVVAPDLVFVARIRRSIILGTRLSAAPDLVVEVLSRATARRDRTAKRQLYKRHGVREYWLIDPGTRTVQRIDFGSQQGEALPALATGQRLASPLFPGLEIAVEDLFDE